MDEMLLRLIFNMSLLCNGVDGGSHVFEPGNYLVSRNVWLYVPLS